MAEASSTSTLRTLMPSGGVGGVLSIMPRIWPAACSAAAGSSASLMPPALPRPPACTCALTTTLPPSRCAISRAWAGVSATSPFGTATPNSRSSALAWYSWTFIRERSQDQRHRLELAPDRIAREAERPEGQRAQVPRVADAKSWSRRARPARVPGERQSSRGLLLLGAELTQQPHDGIEELVGHPLLERDDRVVGDVDVLRADLGAALGDVAQPDA